MEATALHQIPNFARSPHHSMVHPNLNRGQGLTDQYSPNYYSGAQGPENRTPHGETGQGKANQMQTSGMDDTEENGGDGGVPNVEILISNVVCTFSVRCHLNLKRIGMEAHNVEYKREASKVMMKLRRPYCTATIWSSGKITLTGSSSEADAKKSARRIARVLQKLGFKVHFHQFQVVNVLGTCKLPFAIRINQFSRQYPNEAKYEPEIHPAVTYRIKSPKATMKIFSTGSITVTAPSVQNIDSAINHIFPLVEPFKMIRVETKPEKPVKPAKVKQDAIVIRDQADYDSEEDVLDDDDDDDEEEWESELSDDDL